jgi:NAD(P)-dependent dehydrogenase (short-subunit alcohol dehydrogenase family)
MHMRLENKTAIVTGAGGGIGGAIARAFKDQGARLVCADINEAALQETVAANDGAIGISGDAGDEAHAEALVDAAKAEFGGVDVVVTCAIVDVPYLPVTELSVADWKRSLDVNLTGVFLLLKHAIPVMAEGDGGSIILVASQLARAPKPGRAWYASQKGALLSLAKALAVDHADQGIRANTLSPGPTADARFFSQWPSEAEAHAHASTLFERLGEPSEMASGAVFLASDEASFMTGTDLLIDGGYTAV